MLLQRINFSYGLWLSHILLFMCMHHVSFVCPATDGRSGYVHTLPVVNNSEVNIGAHMSFQISVLISLHKYLEVELLGHMVVLFLIC